MFTRPPLTYKVGAKRSKARVPTIIQQDNLPMALLPTSDLNDPNTFPTFFNLPDEYDINDAYFSSTKPRKHWCFLGQVVSSGVFVRLMLEVEDKEGHKMLVAFHTTDRGASYQAICTPGSTIAVLYATQHAFAFSPPGLRLEDGVQIKVFPHTLKAMLKTSKAIFEGNSAAKCEVCGKADENMREKCARCKAVRYCSKASLCRSNIIADHMGDNATSDMPDKRMGDACGEMCHFP
ncbi:hypothetical protein J3R83DRAFT_10278 [Lanmaoa asiatica]|nr:hypothetical protein J3R83DRAFT_10278 [Lanmaoa asiatica]